MDCNMRSPFQWDWENLIMSNPSKTENDKKQQLTTEWEIEKGEGIESIVPSYFSGFERVSSGSASYFSQSTSINSLSPEVKQCKLASERDSCSNIDFVQANASPTALEVSVESDLCLKLGKRTYSEEFSAVSMKLLTPSVVARKKSKLCGQSMQQVPRCQIDGCELDLSSAKDYHRKHRVCENHSKCPKVIVAGLERRFCQQCSRFHAVTEFDEKKRSCRKRLSHHNARRRKPKGVYPLNPVYDRRQHTNMSLNGLSLDTRSEEKYAWGTNTTYDTKESGFTLSFQRGHGSGSEDQLFGSSSFSFSAFQTSGAGKSNFQLPGQGVGQHNSGGGLHESQDFHRALSLLSTSSDSCGTKNNNPLAEPQPIFGTFPTHFI